jgi:hypothetical protein
MIRLVATHGHEEQVFAVPEEGAMLGSGPECDIALRVRGVSRRHAVVKRVPGGIEVADLKSTNGILVERQRVEKTVLTPGFRVQIGAAWLEVEEVSTSEEALARLSQGSSESTPRPHPMTGAAGPERDPERRSPTDIALALAYHIARTGAGVPDRRMDLLIRIKAALQAEAFATLEKTRTGRLRIWESVGQFSEAELKLLTSLVKECRLTSPGEAPLKRAERCILVGRDSWFLAVRFGEEHQARERWRKEFLQFIASQFFKPVRSLGDVDSDEASRVFYLTRENVKRTAILLDVSRGKLYKLLRRLGLPKRWAR